MLGVKGVPHKNPDVFHPSQERSIHDIMLNFGVRGSNR